MSDPNLVPRSREPAVDDGDEWPWVLRISPRTVVWATLGWLAIAGILFLLVDIVGLVDIGLGQPLWERLYNKGPVEWTQWFFLALAIVAAAYLGGRLHEEGRTDSVRPHAARFFVLLSLGLGFMLIEEAGDIRHEISAGVMWLFGQEIFGLPHRVVTDVPYFALLAALPMYAVLRYGRHVWASTRTRPYLAGGVLLYAIVGSSNGLRHLGDHYIRMGAWLDRVLLGGRFPVPEGMTQERAHFYVMDAVVEESVELMAAALLLAAVLAFAADMRQRQTARAITGTEEQGGRVS